MNLYVFCFEMGDFFGQWTFVNCSICPLSSLLLSSSKSALPFALFSSARISSWRAFASCQAASCLFSVSAKLLRACTASSPICNPSHLCLLRPLCSTSWFSWICSPNSVSIRVVRLSSVSIRRLWASNRRAISWYPIR